MFVSISDSILNFCVRGCDCLYFVSWCVPLFGIWQVVHFLRLQSFWARECEGFTKGRLFVHLCIESANCCWPLIFLSQCLGWLWIAKRSRWDGEALEGRYNTASNLSKFQMRAVTMTHMFLGNSTNKYLTNWFPYKTKFTGDCAIYPPWN